MNQLGIIVTSDQLVRFSKGPVNTRILKDSREQVLTGDGDLQPNKRSPKNSMRPLKSILRFISMWSQSLIWLQPVPFSSQQSGHCQKIRISIVTLVRQNWLAS